MARSRVGYLMALMGALAFFLFFNGFFSFYILLLALLFPLFSLAVSLPGMLTLRPKLAASPAMVRRGEGVDFVLHTETRFGLPVGRLSARLVCVNQMTGQTARFRRVGAGGSLGLQLEAAVGERHCGLVHCEVQSLRVYDLLGLFSLPLTPPPAAEALSLPLALPAQEEPPRSGRGECAPPLLPRPGGGPGEDYDLRPYRPGDPLRAIHWKLSSKLDALVVRETLDPVQVRLALTYDHFGPPEELDLVFDRLDALSRALIAREERHVIHWAHPVSGTPLQHQVSSLRDLRAFEREAMAIPAPASGRSVLDQAGALSAPGLRRLHITAGEEDGV